MLKKDEAAARAKAQEEADEMAGFQAFPSTQFSDHLRGLNSFVPEVRCQFKRPERRAAPGSADISAPMTPSWRRSGTKRPRHFA